MSSNSHEKPGLDQPSDTMRVLRIQLPTAPLTDERFRWFNQAAPCRPSKAMAWHDCFYLVVA